MTGTRTTFDNPAWSSLTGHHAHLAERHGEAARYAADVSPFTAISDPADPQAWRDLADLVGAAGRATLVGVDTPGAGWQAAWGLPGVRMIAEDLETAEDPDATVLGPADVEDVLDLVARTKPGPFLPRTIAMGTYLGVRESGRLVALAGERLHPAGGTEISAVCTDPAVRGRGLATRLVRAVAAGVVARGEVPFLHAAASNTGAIALYRKLGFGPPLSVAFTTFERTDLAPAVPTPPSPSGGTAA